jgi:kinesin family protein 4/21/27
VIWESNWAVVVAQSRHGTLELVVLCGDLGTSRSVSIFLLAVFIELNLTHRVALRIRPPTNQDSQSIPQRFQRSVIQANSSTSVSIDPVSNSLANAGAPTVSTGGASKKQTFTFDQVQGPSTTQYEMFESTAKPILSRFLEGYNCTILAYGQTSSGKTFTMTGIDLDADPLDPHNGMGVIPRAVSHIFARANQIKEEKRGAWQYSIKASFIELYNEDLIDLLGEDVNARREVQIREDKDGHIIWGGLREVNVRNANEVMKCVTLFVLPEERP